MRRTGLAAHAGVAVVELVRHACRVLLGMERAHLGVRERVELAWLGLRLGLGLGSGLGSGLGLGLGLGLG